MSEAEQPNSQSPESSGAGDQSQAEEAQPFTFTLPDDPNSAKDWYLWAAVLALIALVAFWPSIQGAFLWDDDRYITQNKALVDSTGLKEIWRIPPGTIQYYPLSFTALWIEHQFWGNNALGYRVVNLLLHAGSAVILWRILRRLRVPGAWAAAAIWAVHPLQVESVCWISEIKNVLSGVLALASALFYLEFAEMRDPDAKRRVWNLTEDWQAYAISVGFFVLAALAKTTVVLLPLAILLVLWWKEKLTLPRALGVAPTLIVGVALGMVTSWLETAPNGAIRATGPEWQLNPIQRLLIAGRDFWFYIGKLILPVNQSFIYPRVVPNPAGIEWAFILTAVVLIIGLAVTTKQLGRGPITAVGCYVLLLFPSMGFFNAYPFRFSFVADHFQYLAGIPLIVVLVWVVAGILKPLWTAERPSAAMTVISALVILVFGAASWVRADIFADQASLWKDVLSENKNPDSWMAAYNLAKSYQMQAAATFDDAANLLQNGDLDSSQKEAKAAIELLDTSDQLLAKVVNNPTTPYDWLYKAHDQWAQNDVTRLRSPDTDPAATLAHASAEMGKALWFPQAQLDPLPYYTLGIVDVNRAQRLQKPSAATMESQTTEASATTEPSATAEASATTMPTTRPYSAEEERLVELYEQAWDNFQKAIALSNSGMTSQEFGPESARVLPLAAYQSGNLDWKLAAMAHEHSDLTAEHAHSVHAAEDYSLAVRLNPTSEDARYRLALALENIGDLPDAKNQLVIILRDLDHYNADAYNEIGVVILKSNPTNMADYQAAIESFKAALNQNHNFTEAKEHLAMAEKMLATTRPATQSATRPSAEPATAP
jgi:tetratricopeptide (TPR) repeat protein